MNKYPRTYRFTSDSDPVEAVSIVIAKFGSFTGAYYDCKLKHLVFELE
jgi:hypothetical protein